MSALGMLVELIGHTTARAVLPILSLGRVYVEPFSASPPPLRWPGYRRDADGRVELRQEAAGWIGLGICVLVLCAMALAIYAAFW